ncbi:hypothetical protein FRACA_870005 [Frankia canadensis]|uniref:Uncharacterized protein n=1 Tax=Frankia canadensis TaxID=1836972 RepID=A0A2I2L1Y3_9ACTN|nr:hypothetical protein FRACA_870005 [Frankia canadensis]SOU59220.1 hypothetical protein FRACA_870005 [Frankia canadensis]
MNNQRIHRLQHVVGLALLLFSLIEREARRAAGPTGTVTGLYARLHPPARPAPAARPRPPRSRPDQTSVIKKTGRSET